jgi:hypothetical protein
MTSYIGIMKLIVWILVPSGSPATGDNTFSDAANVTSAVESAIWTFDSSTSSLIPIWINSDETIAPTTLVYDDADDALLCVGDVDAFQMAFRLNVTTVVSLYSEDPKL